MGLKNFYGVFYDVFVVLNVGYQGISHGILSVPHNNVTDMNNVTCFDYFLHRVMKTCKIFKTNMSK